MLQGMSDGPKQHNSYPYATPEQPRNITDDDLSLLSQYTGEKDLEKLRQHVLTIWRNVKSKVYLSSALLHRQMFPCHAEVYLRISISNDRHKPAFCTVVCSNATQSMCFFCSFGCMHASSG